MHDSQKALWITKLIIRDFSACFMCNTFPQKCSGIGESQNIVLLLSPVLICNQFHIASFMDDLTQTLYCDVCILLVICTIEEESCFRYWWTRFVCWGFGMLWDIFLWQYFATFVSVVIFKKLAVTLVIIYSIRTVNPMKLRFRLISLSIYSCDSIIL